MALLHPDRSDRYEGKRTYTSDACGGLRLRASSGFDEQRHLNNDYRKFSGTIS
ncbi:hypothetical protein [Nostoc sp.]